MTFQRGKEHHMPNRLTQNERGAYIENMKIWQSLALGYGIALSLLILGGMVATGRSFKR